MSAFGGRADVGHYECAALVLCAAHPHWRERDGAGRFARVDVAGEFGAAGSYRV